MRLQFRSWSAINPLLLCLLLAVVPFSQPSFCRAESSAHEAKRAHKIAKKLAKYPDDTYLRLIFRDHSQTMGTVKALTATSFTFTNAETNAMLSYSYADVARVQKARTFIGEGTMLRHRSRFLYLGIAGAAAAGAAAAMVAIQ
jgi:hypothetical protein